MCSHWFAFEKNKKQERGISALGLCKKGNGHKFYDRVVIGYGKAPIQPELSGGGKS